MTWAPPGCRIPAGRRPLTGRAAFTLVELLVVIGVIAVLISLLLPALGSARRAAQRTQCLANLHAIGQAVMMYANDNRSYVPFAAYPNVSANLIQTPDFTLTPPRSYQLYSGLLVRRYLSDSVKTVFCPARDEPGWLQQQTLFRSPAATQAWSNYIHRGTTMKLWPKLKRSRQGVMQDWYVLVANPPSPSTNTVNHLGGANCLYTDGSAIWHRLPRVWQHNTQTAWDQLDRSIFEPM